MAMNGIGIGVRSVVGAVVASIGSCWTLPMLAAPPTRDDSEVVSEALPVLDLPACLEIAVKNQPAIHVQQASLGSAVEQEKIAKVLFFPSSPV